MDWKMFYYLLSGGIGIRWGLNSPLRLKAKPGCTKSV